MLRYVVRRIGLFVIGLLVASAIIFLALRVLPGDVAQVIGGVRATPEQVELIRQEYGLDRPLIVQYLEWLSGLVRFDLGNSLVTGSSIAGEIAEKLTVTVPLCVLALAISIAVGVPLGAVAALRNGTALGSAVSFTAQALAAIPVLWAGLLLISLFGKGVGLVGILPSQGFPLRGWEDPWRALQSLILPAITIGIVEGAVILRYVRSAVLDVMTQDYVRTAAAVGLTRAQAAIRRGLPNASLPILSVIGLQAASLITGTVVVETLFALPGLGSMLVTDVGNRDLIKVQSTVLLLTALVLVIGLLVDIAQRIIDPRQRTAAAP